MTGTTIYVPDNLTAAIDVVKKERKDEKRAVTIRVLLKEALAARGFNIKDE